MSNEINQRNFPDPRMDPLDYQAALAGYENGEEFKKEYVKQAVKAGTAGVGAGMGVFAAGFGLSAGALTGVAELPAVFGAVARFAKNVGVKAWEMAKSAWHWAMGTAATPQGQEILKNTVECVGNLVDGTPPPSTKVGSECFMAKTAIETAEKIKDSWDDLE